MHKHEIVHCLCETHKRREKKKKPHTLIECHTGMSDF